MALLERVSTLLRANINDLLEKAEDPEKMARQLVLDMENQLVQVKTQVAMAIADQHLLEKKRAEQEALRAEWLRKAELAVARQQDALARPALERALSHQRNEEALREQCTDQGADADTLRSAYTRLQQKLNETRERVDLLTIQMRRNRAARMAKTAHAMLDSGASQQRLGRISAKVEAAGARNYAARALVEIASTETLDERFQKIEQTDQIDALLLELKQRQPHLADHS